MDNKHVLALTGEELDTALLRATQSVSYDEQTLTSAQKAQARTNIGVTDWFGVGTSIPSGADLNTYKTDGKFYAESEAIGKSLLNRPTGMNTNFVMWVFRRTTSSIYSQLMLTLTGKMYIRSSNSKTWRAWVAYTTSEEIEELTEAVKADVLATLDNLKPYTDYWWYAPGKGEQDGYEQKVKGSVTITNAFGTGGIRGEEEDMPIPVYYGDSISYDKVTGKYAINGATMLTSNPNNFRNNFNTVLKNKFVAMYPASASSNLGSVVYINKASNLTTTTEKDGTFIEYYYTLAGVTQYTSAPHYRGYISTEDKTTYEGVDGYTLLGTVQEQTLDMRDKIGDIDTALDAILAIQNSYIGGEGA